MTGQHTISGERRSRAPAGILSIGDRPRPFWIPGNVSASADEAAMLLSPPKVELLAGVSVGW